MRPRPVTYRELLRTCRAGGVVEGDGRRTIDAEVIRRCCRTDASDVDPRGIRLRGVRVLGQLDLAGAAVEFPLRFEECVFDSAPMLENAQVASLHIVGSPALPGLLANGLRIRGDLNLSRSAVTGEHRTSASTSKRAAIWLCEAQIGGRLLCVDTTIHTSGERSLQADRMQVGSTVRLLHGFTANAEVRMVGARIDGSLDLTGAQVDTGGSLALDLGEVQVGGSVFLIPVPATGRAPTITGQIDLGNARVAGQFLVRDATVTANSPVMPAGPYGSKRTTGTTIRAARLSVGGEMTFEGACLIDGGTDLSLSDLGSLTVDGTCAFKAPGQVAVNLANSEVRSRFVMSPGTVVEGELLLIGLRVHGRLTLSGVRSSRARDGRLITGSGLVVDGDLHLVGLTADGGWVRFRGATVKGELDLSGAVLDNPGGVALSLYDCVVGGSVLLWKGFRAAGSVLLNRVAIQGRLDCRGGRFECPGASAEERGGQAIEAVSATVRGGLYLGWDQATPSVDFTNATTPILADDPDRWPRRFIVSGLTYDRFGHPDGTGQPVAWDHRKRCEWLSRQAGYDAGPYEHLASVFRRHGYTAEAEAILIEQRHVARRSGTVRPLRRALDAAFGWTVGYGFRPSRVLWLLLGLLIAVAASFQVPAVRDTIRATDERGNVYATDGRILTVDAGTFVPGGPPPRDATTADGKPQPDACGEGQVRCFSPVLFAVDTVVPLIELGQRATWYANAKARHGGLVDWWLNIATLIGWLLSTIFVLSFARLSRAT